jgi:hypothetical protein
VDRPADGNLPVKGQVPAGDGGKNPMAKPQKLPYGAISVSGTRFRLAQGRFPLSRLFRKAA